MNNYSTASANKFTLIEDLPDLEDLERIGPQPLQPALKNNIVESRYPDVNHSQQYSQPRNDKYAKFIRQPYTPHSHSGMATKIPPNAMVPHIPPNSMPHQGMPPQGMPHQGMPHQGMPPSMPLGMQSTTLSETNKHAPVITEHYKPDDLSENLASPGPSNNISCLLVADHINSCPICSKFYNNDKTIYIIAIVVLAIICILLLKKVLNL